LSGETAPCAGSFTASVCRRYSTQADEIVDQGVDLPATQKKADETPPARAKKAIGCHLPWRRLMAARATTSNQPFANLHRRACSEAPDCRDVRPTATETKTPITAATYNHTSLADIIETMSRRAIPKGVQAISLEALGFVCPAVGILHE
jgi:hypothetical protein